MERSIVAIVFLVAVCHAAKDSDMIKSLPGLDTPPAFKQYSGYLKATGTRQLHYWFLESQNDPQNDPVVVWMNGGPGCSSLDGLLSEHGPFKVSNDASTLMNNPYSWNKVANMLYLEAPAGVGFSYATDKNYTTDDDQTSMDNYWALKYFFQNFKEFADNDFYITGESYGGIYVPTLSSRVVDDKEFNFKGFAVGNGITDYNMNDNSLVFFGYYHGIYGKGEWDKLVKYCCNGSMDNCDFSQRVSHTCDELVGYVIREAWSMNVYNLYEDCYHGPGNSLKWHPFNTFLMKNNRAIQAQMKKMLLSSNQVGGVPPCVNVTGVTTWLNKPEVKAALHISPEAEDWQICSDVLTYKTLYKTMKDQYMKVLGAGKRILVYNGDVDMACNFLGCEWFVDSLGQEEVKVWKQWHFTGADGFEQIAGFVRDFKQLRFVTVKGAGHMVPQYKPIPSLEMFKAFLTDGPLN